MYVKSVLWGGSICFNKNTFLGVQFDKRLPWKQNTIMSLIQAKFEESKSLQFLLSLYFVLLFLTPSYDAKL